MINEKRKEKRIPIKLRVDYQCKDNYLFTYSKNLSKNGIFITTKDPLSPGTKLELQFTLSEPKKNINVLGEVIWINEKNKNDPHNQPGMGIKFVNLDIASKDLIEAEIKRVAVLEGVIDENS
jgi:uncharacterized protein (TIGR02266 family)